MRKQVAIYAVAGCCLLLASCGGRERETDKKRESISAVTEKNEKAVSSIKKGEDGKKSEEGKEEKETAESSTEAWISSASFSKEGKFLFPWLNEDILGEVARKFNEETKSVFQSVKETYEEGETEEETASLIRYDSFTDRTAETFSVVSRYLDKNGELRFRSLVLDLKKKEPLSFEEVVKRTGSEYEEVRGQVRGYFETLYSSFAKDRDGVQTPVEMEDYVKERMGAFEEGLKTESEKGKDRTCYAVREGNLDLYFSVRLADGGESFYIPFYVRKDLYSNVLLNGNERSLLGKVNRQGENQPFPGVFVDRIKDIEKGEIYYFVALKDDVKVKIGEVEYQEAKNNFEERKILAEKVLKKGEVIAVQTVVPEGIPRLEISAEAVIRDGEEEYPIFFNDFFTFNGRFKDPDIEYLDGRRDLGADDRGGKKRGNE